MVGKKPRFKQKCVSLGGNCSSSRLYFPSYFVSDRNEYGTSVTGDQNGKMIEDVKVQLNIRQNLQLQSQSGFKKQINNYFLKSKFG
jgi:hypothetical protein